MYSSSKRYACIYGNLCLIIGGQWVSGQNVLSFFFFRVKRVAQLALQELHFISQFNFSLVLLDIVVLNKKLGESALPGKFFLQSYVSKPFASTPCLGDLMFLFFNFAYDLLFVYVITRDKQSFPQISLWVLGPSYGWWMFLSDTVVNNPKEQRQNLKHWTFNYWVKVH